MKTSIGDLFWQKLSYLVLEKFQKILRTFSRFLCFVWCFVDWVVAKNGVAIIIFGVVLLIKINQLSYMIDKEEIKVSKMVNFSE
jgi:hypothetical protein